MIGIITLYYNLFVTNYCIHQIVMVSVMFSVHDVANFGQIDRIQHTTENNSYCYVKVQFSYYKVFQLIY